MKGLPRVPQMERLFDRMPAAVAVAASLLVCLLAAGCSEASSGTPTGVSPSRGSGTSTGSPNAQTSTQLTGLPGSGASRSGGCISSDLSVALANEDHALSHTYVQLVFTNTSRRSCMIGGYPGVSQVDAIGGQLGAAADRTGPAGRALTLVAGQQAHATLTIVSPGVQEGCIESKQTAPAAGLRIYPPANRAALFLRYADPQAACTSPAVHQLTVTALVP